VSKKEGFSSEIAPDFVSTEDVISVTDPDRLMEDYVASCARLIIIGESPDASYKKALLEIKKYDRFVRMVVVPELDRGNLDHFIKQVSIVYKSDKWSL